MDEILESLFSKLGAIPLTGHSEGESALTLLLGSYGLG